MVAKPERPEMIIAYLTVEEKERLRRIAIENRRTMSDTIRQMIAEHPVQGMAGANA